MRSTDNAPAQQPNWNRLMPRYALNHWSIRIARVALRFERATNAAIENVMMQDAASCHYEGRSLSLAAEMAAWWDGFKSGWNTADLAAHPWFKPAAGVNCAASPAIEQNSH